MSITLERGTISVHTFPRHKRDDGTFRSPCDDYPNLPLFISPPKELVRCLEKIARNNLGESDRKKVIYTPCMIDNIQYQEKTSYYRAWLLSPPGIDRNSRLFVPDLAVPNLRLYRTFMVRGNVTGYIMVSDYIGKQEFFVPPHKEIDLEHTYQGVIQDVPEDPRRRPVISIKQFIESIAEKNRSNSWEIRTSDSKFWWKSELIWERPLKRS